MGRAIFVDDDDVLVALEKSTVGLKYVTHLESDDVRNYERVHSVVDGLERALGGRMNRTEDRLRIKLKAHLALWSVYFG
jgi:hypothetical protein